MPTTPDDQAQRLPNAGVLTLATAAAESTPALGYFGSCNTMDEARASDRCEAADVAQREVRAAAAEGGTRAACSSATTVLAVASYALRSPSGRRDAHRWIERLAELTNELGRPVTCRQRSRPRAGADRSVLAVACRRVRAAN